MTKTSTVADQDLTHNDDIKDIGYSPFNEEVVKRDYTSGNIKDSISHEELEEPTFVPPSDEELDNMDDPFNTDNKEEDTTNSPDPDRGFNPHLNELSNKDKKESADMLSEVVLDGYARIKKGVGSLATINENKLDREFAEGTINPNIPLPIDEYGNTATVKEFAKDYNTKAATAFETSDEFKEQVQPLLSKILQKRGAGLTDEQMLGYYVFVDFGSAVANAMQLRKTSNEILNNLRQQSENNRHTAPHQNNYEAPPEPAPTPNPEPTNPVEEESFETVIDDDNELIINDSDGFAETIKDPRMPDFGGDTQLLQDMQEIAERETNKGKK